MIHVRVAHHDRFDLLLLLGLEAALDVTQQLQLAQGRAVLDGLGKKRLCTFRFPKPSTRAS